MKKRITAFFLAVMMLFTVLALAACNECEHRFENGACVECGEIDPNYKAPCIHSFKNGTCTKCGEVDPDYKAPCIHNFNNGSCTECGEPCVHNFKDSECVVCGAPCEHTYESGICSTCGAEDPNYIPEDGGKSLYDAIVRDYKDLIAYKRINEELPKKPANAPFYTDALYEVGKLYNPSIEVGYAFKDIDKNGYLELLLMGRESRIYALFTIFDKEPALVCVFQDGMGYLAPDGTVFYNTKPVDSETGVVTNEKFITRLESGRLVGISYGWTDADGDLATDEDVIYHASSEDGVKAEISYDEYKQYNIYNYYWEYSTRLTKLSGLKFEPALPTPTDTDITADFSSYDAIIDTFGKMHSVVANGKYERSFWVAGKYDFGMTFNTEADYHMYNTLLGACVLVQKSSTAKFGYAIKDLNGDGVNELVLLESKYYVLAIFTEVDGVPVLLDSFTDIRTACIDESGNIHVKQGMITGNKNDAEYFVYEVDGGALVATVAIGVKHNAAGKAERWYKINDGARTEISAEEYGALYAEYISDIGTTEFHTYTKNNSALEFILATSEV